MKVFIGGTRAIIDFDDEVKSKLHTIAQKDFEVLLGDATGYFTEEMKI